MPAIRALLDAHSAHCMESSPEDSNHSLSADDLSAPNIRFWALFEKDVPVGCGALKDLGGGLAEIKSVHVAASARRRGLARRIMIFLQTEARNAGYRELALETGSSKLPEFDAARELYQTLGYEPCDPIPGYGPDPYSVFLRLGLDPRSE